MKNRSAIVLVLLVVFTAFAPVVAQPGKAQSPYHSAMQKGLELMKTNSLQASQLFERIAAAEKEEWLPAYYAAYTHLNNGWGQHGKEKTLQHLEKAQEFLDLAKKRSKDNVEIMVVQGLINTAWITYDSSVYGMKLSGPTTAIYEKALAMAPDNPRVVSNHAQWMIGSARYFGKDTTSYCKNLERAMVLFDTESTDGLAPSWGRERTVEALKECGN